MVPACRGWASIAAVDSAGRGSGGLSWLPVLVASVALSAAVCGIAAAQPPSPETLEKAVGSTVIVRAERGLGAERFQGSGSGFFVHPNGYILTNWRVVADQVEADLGRQKREIDAKVLSLSAVVDCGSPAQRELPAEIIARDRQRGLALLRVDHRPTQYIDASGIQDTGVGHEVWLIGRPSGDFPVTQGTVAGDPNPDNGASRGIVTSLQRDSSGQVAMFQTDAALDLVNSGCAMVNADGQLVGVAFSGASGGQVIGSGVSSNRIREFLRRQSIRIEFSPRVVMSPPQPIHVVVEPILLESGLEGGEVRFEGEDIEPVSFVLRPVEGDSSFAVTITVPPPISGRQRPEKYFADFSLHPGTSEQEIRRRFALKAMPVSAETVMGEPDPSRIKEVRKTPAYEIKLGSSSASERKRLSDIAGSVKIERDDSGSVVIDQLLVQEVGAVAIDPNRFKRVGDPQLRRQLEKYDRLATDVAVLEKARRTAVEVNDYTSWAYALDLEERIIELRTQKSELARVLRLAKIRWCADSQIYFEADGQRAYYPCAGQTLY